MRKLIYPCNPDKDTIEFLDKECYVIYGPSSSRSTKYRICKGYFHKASMYGICFSGNEVDKNDKRISGCGPDSYLPRYTWNDFLEFLGLPIIDRNKLTALTFDNYEEAKQCLDDFLKFRYDKWRKQWLDYINSDEVLKEYDTKLNDITNCLDNLTDKPENIDTIRQIYTILNKAKLV
jgi:hypothetical protein